MVKLMTTQPSTSATSRSEGLLQYATPDCELCGGSGVLTLERDDHTQSFRQCACVQVGRRLAAAELVIERVFPGRQRLMTLARYETGSDATNELALQAARNFVEEWPRAVAEGWTVGFYGPVNSGKTHLACGTAQALVKRWGVRPMIIDVPMLLRRERQSFSDASASSSVDQAASAGLLVLDDIGSEYMRAQTDARSSVNWVDEQLFLILNERVNYNRPTIYTSNLSPSQLGEMLAERVWSRIQRTLVSAYEVHPVAAAQRAGLTEARELLNRPTVSS